MNNISLDQIAFYLAKSVMFCQMPKWEEYKYSFLSIILCTVAGIKEDSNQNQPKPTG